MKSKTVVLMVVAVVCGLAASYMTSRLLADRNEKVKVLVAKRKFGPWTHIKNPDDMFELDERPKNEVPKNAILRPESIKDHVTIKSMDAGDVVVADNLMDKTKGSLDVQLPPGKRAVAVRTTQETATGGFVLPGSHVDVLHTIKKGDKEPECRVILQNILVRAVDQQMVKPEDRAGFVPATVTLEVTPEQAKVLARIKDVGSITLSLRPFGDDKEIDTAEVVEEKVEPKKEPEPEKKPEPVVVQAPPMPPPEEPPVEKTTMLVLNGSSWIRATYVTRNGETQATFEQSSGDSSAAPPAVPTPPPPPPARPTVPSATPGKPEPKELGGNPPPDWDYPPKDLGGPTAPRNPVGNPPTRPNK